MSTSQNNDNYSTNLSPFSAEPKFVAISHTHIIASSECAVYVWHYRTTSRLATSKLTHVTSRRGEAGEDVVIHVEKHPLVKNPPKLDFNLAKDVSVCMSIHSLTVRTVCAGNG